MTYCFIQNNPTGNLPAALLQITSMLTTTTTPSTKTPYRLQILR